MKKIDRLVIGEMLGPWVFGVAIFTVLISAGQFLFQITSYLASGADVWSTIKLLAYFMPGVIAKTLSMSMLLGTLLAFVLLVVLNVPGCWAATLGPGGVLRWLWAWLLASLAGGVVWAVLFWRRNPEDTHGRVPAEQARLDDLLRDDVARSRAIQIANLSLELPAWCQCAILRVVRFASALHRKAA